MQNASRKSSLGASLISALVALSLSVPAYAAPSLKEELVAGIADWQKKKPDLSKAQAAGLAIQAMGRKRGLKYKEMHTQLSEAGIVRSAKTSAAPVKVTLRETKAVKPVKRSAAPQKQTLSKLEENNQFYAMLNRMVKEGKLSLADQQLQILNTYDISKRSRQQASAAAAYAPAQPATKAVAAIQQVTANDPVQLDRSELKAESFKARGIQLVKTTSTNPKAPTAESVQVANATAVNVDMPKALNLQAAKVVTASLAPQAPAAQLSAPVLTVEAIQAFARKKLQTKATSETSKEVIAENFDMGRFGSFPDTVSM